MYKHILIPTDGSELAGRGVEHGLALASALGARATVLTVMEPLDARLAHDALTAPVGRYEQSIDQTMKLRFAEVEKRAAEHGVEVDLTHELDEHPAEAIVRSAKLHKCDLIVMSSHGHRGVKRLLLGSQTAEVVTTSTIPVLVVR
jgi:nucleotide-binding universal stress UspA family protein